jgi:DNA-binding LytR/AlgR family response regulator
MPQLDDGNRHPMRKNDNSSRRKAAREAGGRLLLHVGPGLRQAVEADDVYFVAAAGDDTTVRTRSARALRDVRPIGEVARLLAAHGFVRTHRNYLVNPAHVREVRRRGSGEDWEVRLDPPVSAILPVSRSALRALWATFGED